MENLKNRGLLGMGVKPKVMFLMEDVSPICPVMRDPESSVQKTECMNLSKSLEFLTLLSKSPKVDYGMLCIQAAPQNIFFIDRNYIKDYQRNAVDLNRMRIVFETIYSLGGKMEFESKSRSSLAPKTEHAPGEYPGA